MTGSYIGPFTSIAEDCRISGSEIKYSIVLRGARIEGVRRIEASIIERRRGADPGSPDAQRGPAVLGDHSQVKIGS